MPRTVPVLYAPRTGWHRVRRLVIGASTMLTVALGAATASAAAPTFDSATATGDSGTHFTDGSTGKDYTFEIFAYRGPSGENPSGSGGIWQLVADGPDYPNGIDYANAISGSVRCLRVQGNRAVIGLASGTGGQSVYVFEEDNGDYAVTPDRFEFTLTDVAPTLGSCPAPRQPANPLSPYTDTTGMYPFFPGNYSGGNLRIVDAQPSTAVSCDLTLMPGGCWHFGEAPGSTTAIDSSPNHTNGTYVGGVTLGVPGALAGDTAALFDGQDDFVRVPDSNSLDVGDSFSAEGWIKRSSETKTHELMNKGANGLQLVVMAATSGNQVWLRKANVATLAHSTTGIAADGRFHHVVATKSGPGSSRIYIDGVDRTAAGTMPQLIQDTALPLYFSNTTPSSTPATFDEFALYDRALTPSEVAARFALGAPPPA